MEAEFSVANFWHDPLDEKRYLANAASLPFYNNLISTSNSSRYKSNFLRVQRAVFAGSPTDALVEPWNTEVFGFYKKGSASSFSPAQQQDFYVKDSFGLRTMAEQGRATFLTVNGIPHADWLFNKANFVQNILPWLR